MRVRVKQIKNYPSVDHKHEVEVELSAPGLGILNRSMEAGPHKTIVFLGN